jgi:hypothetical protein
MVSKRIKSNDIGKKGCFLLHRFVLLTFFFNEIGGGFICGNALGLLETFINWIKAWKSSHGAKVQMLSLEYGKSNIKYNIL